MTESMWKAIEPQTQWIYAQPPAEIALYLLAIVVSFTILVVSYATITDR